MTYLLGGHAGRRFVVTPKYIGARRLIEIAVATLATDRGLLLYGVPGTAKSWVSGIWRGGQRRLDAADPGHRRHRRGTSALRLELCRAARDGPSEKALVPSPLMNAMRTGRIARIEELTRIPADVQDTLITVLSEKTLPVPELGVEVQAVRGFSVIATANNRDKGVNELSSAPQAPLQHRDPAGAGQRSRRMAIVVKRVTEMGSRARPAGRAAGAARGAPRGADLPRAAQRPDRGRQDAPEEPERHALDRRGDLGGQHGTALAGHFGDGVVGAADLAPGLLGAVIKDRCRMRWSGRNTWRRSSGARRLEGPLPRLPRAEPWLNMAEVRFLRHSPPRPGLRTQPGACLRGLAARRGAGRGPPEADGLLPHLNDAGAGAAGGALLVHAVETPQQAVFYPFARSRRSGRGCAGRLARAWRHASSTCRVRMRWRGCGPPTLRGREKDRMALRRSPPQRGGRRGPEVAATLRRLRPRRRPSGRRELVEPLDRGARRGRRHLRRHRRGDERAAPPRRRRDAAARARGAARGPHAPEPSAARKRASRASRWSAAPGMCRRCRTASPRSRPMRRCSRACRS